MLLRYNSLHERFLVKNYFRFISLLSTKSQVASSVQNKNSNEKNSLSKSANFDKVWSPKQIPKSLVMKGARFETVHINKQPNPIPAIELIAKAPVIQVHENIVSCDGGGGRLGHPKIYINLVISMFIKTLFSLNVYRIKNNQFLVLIVGHATSKSNVK